MFYLARQGWRSWQQFRAIHPALYHSIMLLLWVPLTIFCCVGAWYCLHYFFTTPMCVQDGSCNA